MVRTEGKSALRRTTVCFNLFFFFYDFFSLDIITKNGICFVIKHVCDHVCLFDCLFVGTRHVTGARLERD